VPCLGRDSCAFTTYALAPPSSGRITQPVYRRQQLQCPQFCSGMLAHSLTHCLTHCQVHCMGTVVATLYVSGCGA
jgi:hypothetical protein